MKVHNSVINTPYQQNMTTKHTLCIKQTMSDIYQIIKAAGKWIVVQLVLGPLLT